MLNKAGVLLEKATEIDNHRFANLYSENVIVAMVEAVLTGYMKSARQSVKLKGNEIDIGVESGYHGISQTIYRLSTV